MATFNNALGALGTAEVAIYTCPAGNAAVINSASFANIAAAVVDVTVRVKQGATFAHIIKGGSVPANGTMTLKPETQVILKAGDQLMASASAAASIDYFVSVTEI